MSMAHFSTSGILCQHSSSWSLCHLGSPGSPGRIRRGPVGSRRGCAKTTSAECASSPLSECRATRLSTQNLASNAFSNYFSLLIHWRQGTSLVPQRDHAANTRVCYPSHTVLTLCQPTSPYSILVMASDTECNDIAISLKKGLTPPEIEPPISHRVSRHWLYS